MNKKFATLGALVSLALVLGGCSVRTDNPNTPNGSSFDDDGCIHITIATSSEKVNLMDELAEVFKDSPETKKVPQCITVKPINVSSGFGTDVLATSPTEWPLADAEYWPSLWSPASTIWTNHVSAVAPSVIADAQSFTHTPVVFAMPEGMAKVLGWPNEAISLTDIHELITSEDGWGLAGKPVWGDFRISKTNPTTSTTGLSMILMQAYEASGKTEGLTVEDIEASAEFSRGFESGAIHYGDTTGKVLTTLFNATTGGTGYVSAIAVEETSLINYNLGNPDSHTVQPGEVLTPPKEKLVAIYPENGSMWSDNPVTVINRPWVTPEKAQAAQAFADFLQTRAAQVVLPKYGFRPLDETVPLGNLFTLANGINPEQPAISLPQPDTLVVSAARDQWFDIRKPSAVLELIDLSGSMEGQIGDGRSLLEGAIDGVNDTLSHFRRTDNIGVWGFTTGLDSKYGENILVVREYGALANDLEKIRSDVSDLNRVPLNGTPLYDAILTAYEYMQDKAEVGRINAIVVLTDGEDANSRTSLDTLLLKINASQGEAKGVQVRIFPIAYGPGANFDVLDRIAQASGGQTFRASDPAQINTVFASVINNF